MVGGRSTHTAVAPLSGIARVMSLRACVLLPRAVSQRGPLTPFPPSGTLLPPGVPSPPSPVLSAPGWGGGCRGVSGSVLWDWVSDFASPHLPYGLASGQAHHAHGPAACRPPSPASPATVIRGRGGVGATGEFTPPRVAQRVIPPALSEPGDPQQGQRWPGGLCSSPAAGTTTPSHG